MQLVELTEYLFKNLALKPDEIKVKTFETDDEDFILLQVMVDESDMGRVLGKGGKVANSIRTIVQAAATNQGKKIKINIDSF